MSTDMYQPDYRAITVKTIDGSIIHGKINISSKERISEVFTQGENPFIVLVDVAFREGNIKTLIINKDHIVWVEPED